MDRGQAKKIINFVISILTFVLISSIFKNLSGIQAFFIGLIAALLINWLIHYTYNNFFENSIKFIKDKNELH